MARIVNFSHRVVFLVAGNFFVFTRPHLRKSSEEYVKQFSISPNTAGFLSDGKSRTGGECQGENFAQLADKARTGGPDYIFSNLSIQYGSFEIYFSYDASMLVV